MKISKLRIKNMYGVKGDVEYDLSPRIVGLFGKNGAGKSSVINSLKLAIGGEKTSSAMLRGVDNSAVRIQTDTVTIDRQLKKTETGSVMTGWIDGKKTPGNRIQRIILKLYPRRISKKALQKMPVKSCYRSRMMSLLLQK